MAARVYDIYDLNSPMVMPTAPAVTPQAPTATRNSDRLLRASVYLLAFAGALLLAALIVTVTPLGAIDADIGVPFTAVAVGVPAAIVIMVLR
jgi:hypothetical protein